MQPSNSVGGICIIGKYIPLQPTRILYKPTRGRA